MASSAATKANERVPGNAEQLTQGAWFLVGNFVAFALPFIFSSLLDLDHDIYYLVYFAGVSALLLAYALATRLNIRDLFARGWAWSLALGSLAALFVVFNVLNREDSTPRPDGLYFVFSLGWRGVVYGVVDALLLTAFPVAVAYALLGGQVQSITRRTGFAALALALSMIITATYHLGYEQFREDGIVAPEIGNVIMTLPAALTTNPLGSVLAHASMHVAADSHAYETDVFLPPQTDVGD